MPVLPNSPSPTAPTTTTTPSRTPRTRATSPAPADTSPTSRPRGATPTPPPTRPCWQASCARTPYFTDACGTASSASRRPSPATPCAWRSPTRGASGSRGPKPPPPTTSSAAACSSIDKHAGKTDAQLEQRLRDQAKVRPDGTVAPIAASTFTDLTSAQRYTQGVLDDPGNQQKIANWLASNPNPDRSKRTVGLTFNDTVGRTWTRGDSAAHDSHIVNVTLKPRPGGHPPYVVLTSIPSDTVQS